MYQGEVNVVQEQLASFLTTAELLAVQGLTDGTGKDNDSLVEVCFSKLLNTIKYFMYVKIMYFHCFKLCFRMT